MARQVLTYPDIPPVLTQAVADGRYLPLSHEPGVDPHTQYLNTTRGDARYLQTTIAAATYSPLGHNHDAAYVNVSGDTMTNSLIVNMNSSTSRTTYSDWGMWSRDTNQPNDCFVCTPYGLRFGDGATPLDTRIRRVGVAALQIEANAVGVGQGVVPGAWHVARPAIQVAGTAALWGYAGGEAALLTSNVVQDAANTPHAILTGPGAQVALSGGVMNFANAPSVAAGALQTFTSRLTVDANGTTAINSASPTGLVVTGEIVSQGAAAQLRAADRTTGQGWLLFSGGGQFAVYKADTGGGGGAGTKAMWNASGTLTLTPDAGQAAITIGVNPAVINTSGGAGLILRAPGGGGIAVTPGNSLFTPEADNAIYLGWSSARWSQVWAVNGVIQTSAADMKQDITPLDPTACAAAVLETEWVSFSYLPPAPPEYVAPSDIAYDEHDSNEVKAEKKVLRDEAEAAAKAQYAKMLVETKPARDQRGYVLGSPEHQTADLFGLSDRKSASPSSDLAVVACALQAALLDIAELKARLSL